VSVVNAPASLTVHWEQVGLVWVNTIATNEDGGAGWWPDPLLTTPHALGVVGITTSVWVTVYAASHTPAETHTFAIHLTPVVTTPSPAAPPEESAPPTTIVVPVNVTVFGFSLPTQPALLTAFDLSESHIAKARSSFLEQRHSFLRGVSIERASAQLLFVWC
jgi:hypothetical protein